MKKSGDLGIAGTAAPQRIQESGFACRIPGTQGFRGQSTKFREAPSVVVLAFLNQDDVQLAFQPTLQTAERKLVCLSVLL